MNPEMAYLEDSLVRTPFSCFAASFPEYFPPTSLSLELASGNYFSIDANKSSIAFYILEY